ncbi:uncharacterized protein LOC131249467 [Magnolia sinica]|uniref:uncharacterized protein LOC131249467 n=1 Tax=Magnolia sinica TaxID=86752 RepID=UPI002658BC08|nr:uncharacterized protein LOC131249467 [Magnolia sinica]
MAIPEVTPAYTSKLRIEAIQTVIPSKVAGPGLRRRISVSGPLRSDIYRKHIHIVLCYKKTHEDECGWMVAGWLKESMNSVLSEYPAFAGRLRRGSHGDDRELAIVFNDSGIRLVQAQMDMTLSEFLNSSEREDSEAELAFWKDVDEENPQYSALFYVQDVESGETAPMRGLIPSWMAHMSEIKAVQRVTNFQGDGYSIGITSSVLLADPILMTSFIRRWAHIHDEILAQNTIPKIPLFYLPNFKKTDRASTTPLTSTPCNHNHYQTMTFKLPNMDSKRFMEANETCEAIASLCSEEAVRILGGNETFSKLSFIFNDRSGDWRVITCVEEGQIGYKGRHEGAMGPTSWDDLGANEVSFYKGNMPVHVAYHVESCHDEGLVLIMPPIEEGSLGIAVSVTVPK